MVQATDNPTPKFDIEALNALAVRLAEHADATLAHKDAERDLRLASAVCDRLAHFRFEVGEIAAKCQDADTTRELRDALAEAAQGV
jgi:hypothetical protein